MKLTLLGTGTSQGVPLLGCDCEVCKSSDPRDRRLRTAALLETDSTRILIDCGPDIRMQLMNQPFKKIDAVLLSHIHYDHVAGIDDLRPYCKFGDIPLYAEQDVVDGLRNTMPYCFTKHLYPGVPKLNLHVIRPHQHLRLGDIDVLPIRVLHGNLPILGYRFGNLVYITDMKTMPSSEYVWIDGVKVLIVNALRWEKEHHSHQLVNDALAFSKALRAEQTYLIHVTHQIGLHELANRRLPLGVEIGYDGQVIEV
ncbi:MBL fold metallo-hydrolase [Prevotella sp. A2931]|uniref:MBL fold metallo-hydrolase n=1 Tax=Prevotella illustrans TaxID=2800387 RepID=A0ABS3M7U8_9BACT|nr:MULTISPECIES: MBL fold metallo-hydrolase [Prevotella]MBO1364205.1 MBL fold metallo-hydrolase [Prevotella illustrans]PTL25397.1 lipoate--protein ligase [Prevotella sp. oral taxon 820]